MALLNPGDRFPALTLNLAAGGTLDVPSALAGSFGVVLFNRGSWCPYCVAQRSTRVTAWRPAPDAIA
jgi:peroxiredoxin